MALDLTARGGGRGAASIDGWMSSGRFDHSFRLETVRVVTASMSLSGQRPQVPSLLQLVSISLK